MMKLFVAALLVLVLELMPARTYAQSTPMSEELFKTIQALDTQFFDVYNHCDLATISSMIADDLEFYHDKAGLALGRQALLDGLKSNMCNKVTRELVPGTLEVYPIAKYGAVVIGVHRSIIPDPTTMWEKRSLFNCGKTRMGSGRLPVRSALIISQRQSDSGEFQGFSCQPSAFWPGWFEQLIAQVQASLPTPPARCLRCCASARRLEAMSGLSPSLPETAHPSAHAQGRRRARADKPRQ